MSLHSNNVHHRSSSTGGGGGRITTTSHTASLTSSSSLSSHTNHGMDGIAIIRHYVDKMVQLNHSTTTTSTTTSAATTTTNHHHHHHHGLNSHHTNGTAATTTTTTMKILLLDAITTQIMSAVYTQTEILQQHIYLVTTLEKSVQQKKQQSIPTHPNHLNSSNTNTNSNSHLTAICFIRPTSTNIDLLCQELQIIPHYAEYHIYFTGTVMTQSNSSSSSSSNPNNYLRQIAESDIYEKVKHIYEYYSDFVPVNPDVWTIQCRNSIPMTMSAGTSYAPQHAVQYDRHITSIGHMLLALKQYPTHIRYAKHSPCAEEMANDIAEMIQNDTADRYYFRNSHTNSSGSSSSSNGGGLVLLIVDRRDDPVTPLLSQWTYQAMVHELLGLNNHRVLLKGAPDISKELEEVVLSIHDDMFYKEHQFSNFGVLGEAIQQLLRDYQQQSAHHTSALRASGSSGGGGGEQNLTTVAEMQQFMEKYPELRTKSHVVSKHVAIMSELARLVQLCSLMDVSQFEQALACQDDHSTHWRELMDKLASTSIKIPDKLRLSLLYALRYETSANLHMLQQMMSKGGVPQNMISYIPTILRYGGYEQRTPNRLYAESHNLVSRMTKNIVGAVAGVDNVYAQHVPLIMDIVQQLLRGRLSAKDYPIVSTSSNTSNGAGSAGHHRTMTSPSSSQLSGVGHSGFQSSPPKTSQHNSSNNNNNESLIPDEILIFMVGGVTYEEGLKIAELNKSLSSHQQNSNTTPQHNNNHRIRIVLAGSTIHNSTSFLDELRTTAM